MSSYSFLTEYDGKGYAPIDDCTGYFIASRGSGKTAAVQKAIYEALCEPYKPTITYTATPDWYKTPAVTKEDLKGDDKVNNFIKDVEIKKKVSKKGSCMQYNFILYGTHAFLTVENYDEDCNMSADFILSLAHICYVCSVNKLIFRDHKVISISKDERCCGEDEKTKELIWKHKSYVADCMDVDDYDPYIGATIAISKCVADSRVSKDSKSHLRRLREKIDQVSEDA